MLLPGASKSSKEFLFVNPEMLSLFVVDPTATVFWMHAGDNN